MAPVGAPGGGRRVCRACSGAAYCDKRHAPVAESAAHPLQDSSVMTGGLVEPRLLALPDEPLIAQPRPDRAVREMHAVALLEGALHALERPEHEGLAEALRLLHRERDELVAHRGRVRRGTPPRGASCKPSTPAALNRRTQRGPASSRVNPARRPAAVADRAGSSSSARFTQARWTTPAGAGRDAASRRTAAASVSSIARSCTRGRICTSRQDTTQAPHIPHRTWRENH